MIKSITSKLSTEFDIVTRVALIDWNIMTMCSKPVGNNEGSIIDHLKSSVKKSPLQDRLARSVNTLKAVTFRTDMKRISIWITSFYLFK